MTASVQILIYIYYPKTVNIHHLSPRDCARHLQKKKWFWIITIGWCMQLKHHALFKPCFNNMCWVFFSKLNVACFCIWEPRPLLAAAIRCLQLDPQCCPQRKLLGEGPWLCCVGDCSWDLSKPRMAVIGGGGLEASGSCRLPWVREWEVKSVRWRKTHFKVWNVTMYIEITP